MAIGIANQWSAQAASASSVSVTVSGFGAGELVAVNTRMFNNSLQTINAPTDDAGNTYTQGNAPTWDATFRAVCEWAWSANIAGAPTSVTAHMGNPVSVLIVVVLRVTSANPSSVLDAESAQTNTTSATPTTANLVTTNANDLLVTVITHDGAQTTLTAPAGFSLTIEDEPNNWSVGHQVVSATQNQTYQWTVGASRDYNLSVIAFKDAGVSIPTVVIPNIAYETPITEYGSRFYSGYGSPPPNWLAGGGNWRTFFGVGL